MSKRRPVYSTPEADEWRKTPSGGAAYLHEPTGLRVLGIIYDVWLLRVDGRLMIDWVRAGESLE